MKPSIAVLIPTFNRERYIEECIESVLRQSVAADEIWVVDDGSEDDTESVVRGYEHRGVKYIQKEHTGAPEARNVGWRRCCSDYLVTVGSDDVMFENSLETLRAAFEERPGLDFYYGDLVAADVELKPLFEVLYPRIQGKSDWLQSGLAFTNPIGDGFGMVKIDLLRRLGGYSPDFPRAHDWELWSRAGADFTLSHVGAALGYWRWHSSNLSANRSDTGRLSFDRIIRERVRGRLSGREHLENLGWSALGKREDRPVFVWGAGEYGEAMLGLLERVEARVEGFIDSDPEKAGGRYLGLEVKGPAFLEKGAAKPLVVIASMHEGEIAAALEALGFVEGEDYFRVRGVEYRSVC